MRRRRLSGLCLQAALAVLCAATLAQAETECGGGEYLSGGTCVSCDIGYFSDATDEYPCFECPGGYYTAVTGSTACTACAPGSASGPGWNQTACAECPAGKFSAFRIVLPVNAVDPGINCHGCLKGKYSNAAKSTTCTECDLGKYQSDTGKTECVQCPSGTYGTAQAQLTVTECGLCGAGRYATPGNIGCADCAAGTFAPFMTGAGVNECVACEEPFVALGTGNYKCELCEPGRYRVSATQCADCAAGNYAPAEHQTACVECEAGKYQPATGRGACQEVFDNTVPGADSTTLGYESKAGEVTGQPGWRLVRFIPTESLLSLDDEGEESSDGLKGTLELSDTPFTYTHPWSVLFGSFSEILAGKCTLTTGEYIWINGDSSFHSYDNYRNPKTQACNCLLYTSDAADE